MNAQMLLQSFAGGDGEKTYVDDVFSTYLYTGNGSTQTINNGIDLAGEGGLVWVKSRNSSENHVLADSVRGFNKTLRSNSDIAQGSSASHITGVSSGGFTLGNDENKSGFTYTSWTFRKAPKFFDIVTYTGNGSTQNIAHDLGVQPGMVVVKAINNVAGSWAVWHRRLSAGYKLYLESTGSQSNTASANCWGNNTVYVDPTENHFTVGSNSNFNQAGATYVAYLFAHDPSADGIIQCGSFTTDASGNATVNLGWEPQFLITKSSTGAYSWDMRDVMRGLANTGDSLLQANLSDAEANYAGAVFIPTATGFRSIGCVPNQTVIYLAIRRPNKPPKTGVEVLTVRQGTGTSLMGQYGDDLAIWKQRNGTVASLSWGFVDRLRGISPWTSWRTNSNTSSPTLYSSNIAATEVVSGSKAGQYPGTSGAGGSGGAPNTITVLMNDGTNTPQGVAYFFRRAPGFFDVVCYTGTGVARTVNHSLGVAPELMIVKRRDGVSSWRTLVTSLGASSLLFVDGNSSVVTGFTAWNNTLPSASVFSLGGAGNDTNNSGDTYVTYLFATLSGISKVGSYTGNGTSLSVECGFSTGARFILVKSVDAVGDWYVWDSTRGIVAANDPHLSLNTTAAEVTTDDSVDPYTGGFIVNQNTATNINISGKRYIFLAIA